MAGFKKDELRDKAGRWTKGLFRMTTDALGVTRPGRSHKSFLQQAVKSGHIDKTTAKILKAGGKRAIATGLGAGAQAAVGAAVHAVGGTAGVSHRRSSNYNPYYAGYDDPSFDLVTGNQVRKIPTSINTADEVTWKIQVAKKRAKKRPNFPHGYRKHINPFEGV